MWIDANCFLYNEAFIHGSEYISNGFLSIKQMYAINRCLNKSCYLKKKKTFCFYWIFSVCLFVSVSRNHCPLSKHKNCWIINGVICFFWYHHFFRLKTCCAKAIGHMFNGNGEYLNSFSACNHRIKEKEILHPHANYISFYGNLLNEMW